jgi:KDO2-lipid IV(A) lauroyltransferase
LSPSVVAGYRLAAALACRMPRRIGEVLARLLGRIAGRLDSDRRRMVERHVRRTVDPDLVGRALRRSVDTVFASYAEYWYRSFRLPEMTPAAIEAGFTHEGYERIVAARRTGVGPIMAMPHLGSWEWAAFWLARVEHVPVSAVVEALDPPELLAWFRSLRTSVDIDVITLGSTAGAEVIRAVRQNRAVCLPCDRHVGGVGVEVEFFGETTLLPAGPATVALRTGAALLPIAIYDHADGCHGVVRPAIPTERLGRLRDDVARVTQLLASEIEGLIRRSPKQWHLLQPNWPSDLLPRPVAGSAD